MDSPDVQWNSEAERGGGVCAVVVRWQLTGAYRYGWVCARARQPATICRRHLVRRDGVSATDTDGYDNPTHLDYGHELLKRRPSA